jgi:WD40 repeat protein
LGLAALSRDGAWVGFVNEEDRIVCHDLQRGELGTFAVKGEKVIAVNFTPDRNSLVSLGYEPPLPDEAQFKAAIEGGEPPPPVNLRTWDVRHGKQAGSLAIRTFPTSIDFSPDGRVLALGGFDKGSLGVWLVNLVRWRVLHSFHAPFSRFHVEDGFPEVRFTPDGKGLYAVCVGFHFGTGAPAGVMLWDLVKRREQAHFTVDRLFCWAVLPDSLTFASGAADGTLKLWDMRSGQERLSIQAHDRAIVHLAFSADGKTLTSVDRTGLLKVWDGDVGAEP